MARSWNFWAMILAATVGLPGWAESPLAQVSLADLEGKPLTLARLQERVTVLIVANRGNADSARDVGQDIVFQFGPNKGFAFISVIDLNDVPSFGRGIATGIIKEQVQESREELKTRVTKAGRAYVPAYAIYVPDWEGKLALSLLKASPLPEFAIFKKDVRRLARFDQEKIQREQQKLRSRIHVFILDQKGEIIAHYLDRGAAQQVISKVKGLVPS